MNNTDPILSIKQLRQRLYDPARGDEFVVTVDQPIELCNGDFAALLGPSGCGKTTLLTVLGLLRKPSNIESNEEFLFNVSTEEGLNQIDIKEAWLKGRNSLIDNARRSHIGFALQSGELLQSLSVAENIAVPLKLNKYSPTAIKSRVDELIDSFGLVRSKVNDSSSAISNENENDSHASDDSHYSLANAKVNKLSGGEYQRVVLARAIAHSPDLIFVDEPTAALNRELARQALNNLKQLQNEERCAVLMITHDEELAAEFSNIIIRMEPVRGKPAGHIREIRHLDDQTARQTS